jgi:hypothetical protein
VHHCTCHFAGIVALDCQNTVALCAISKIGERGKTNRRHALKRDGLIV